MHLWRRVTGRRRSATGHDRSRLEAGLRQYYASAFEEGWDSEAEGRVHARVSRAIAAHRVTSPAPGRTFRIKRVTGSHVAAIVCAGAAVIAFSNLNRIGKDDSRSYVPPTSAPLSGKPAKAYANARLSMVAGWPSNNLARAV
jgi:hypothetical protein